jgi:hypothetical protein
MSQKSIDRKKLLKLGLGGAGAALVAAPTAGATKSPKPPTQPPGTPAVTEATVRQLATDVAADFGLPGYVNLHSRKYGTPTDGTTNALPAIQMAMADVPIGGTLQFGPYRYALPKLDLSDRPDIRLLAHGGSAAVDTVYGTYFVPTNADVGAIVDCSPRTLSQHGPSIEGINVINEAGLSGIGGFTVVNCNGYRIARCGVKYATLTGFEFRYGRESGEDHAWQHVEDFWAYQCKIGFHCDQLLGMRAYSGRIDTVDGGIGMLWTGFPQNMFFFGLFIDGQNAAGVAKGTGILVHESGAHDNHIIGYKLEACAIGAEIRNGPGPGTSHITFTDGEVSGVDEGTASGKGFELAQGVRGVEVRGTRLFNMPAENRWIDHNHPSTNRLIELEPQALAADADAAAIGTWLRKNGLSPQT